MYDYFDMDEAGQEWLMGYLRLPDNDKTGLLLKRLVDGGFIGKETRLADFRALFGVIHGRLEEDGFLPVRWLMNTHLLRYFMERMIGLTKDDPYYYDALRQMAGKFVKRDGKPFMFPRKDATRLSARERTQLDKILEEYFG